MIVKCANCSQEYHYKPTVDLKENIIIWDNRGIRLAPREAEILFYMLQFDDVPFSTRDIHAAIAELTSDAAPDVVRQLLWRLKPRLATIGIDVGRRVGCWVLEWRRLSDPISTTQAAQIE